MVLLIYGFHLLWREKVISAFIPFASVLLLCVILLIIMAKGGIANAILGMLISGWALAPSLALLSRELAASWGNNRKPSPFEFTRWSRISRENSPHSVVATRV